MTGEQVARSAHLASPAPHTTSGESGQLLSLQIANLLTFPTNHCNQIIGQLSGPPTPAARNGDTKEAAGSVAAWRSGLSERACIEELVFESSSAAIQQQATETRGCVQRPRHEAPIPSRVLQRPESTRIPCGQAAIEAAGQEAGFSTKARRTSTAGTEIARGWAQFCSRLRLDWNRIATKQHEPHLGRIRRLSTTEARLASPMEVDESYIRSSRLGTSLGRRARE